MSYKKLQKIFHKIADVSYSISVLHWDQETNIPINGVEKRAQQMATLSGIEHKMSTSKKIGKLLKKLKKDKNLSKIEKKNVKLAYSDYKKQKNFSTNFIIKESKAISTAFQAWIAARQKNDFNIYIPALTEIVNIQREKAEIIEYKKKN